MLLLFTTFTFTLVHVIIASTQTCYSCYDGTNSDIHGTLLKYFETQYQIQTLLPFGDVICRKPRSIQCTDSCVGIKVVKNDTLRGTTTNYFLGCSNHFNTISDKNPLKCSFRHEEVGYNRYVLIEYCTCGTTMCNDPKKAMLSWTSNDDKKKEYSNFDAPTTPKFEQVTTSASKIILGSIFWFGFYFNQILVSNFAV